MVKINRKEYEILKGLDDEWKWIARDKNGSLFAYLEKPLKDPYSRDWGLTGDEWFLIKEILFQFIQWEDEEPHNIQELIEEYEKYKKASDYFKVNMKNVNQSMLDDLPKESEETETKKDIEWVTSEIEQRVEEIEAREETTPYSEGVLRGLGISLFLIDELDELKTLSQEWIDKHVWSNDHVCQTFVYVDDLQEQLVPKQEEITEEQALEVLSELYDIPNKSYIREAMRVVAGYVGDESTLGELKEQLAKPVIPKFVAEWIDSRKNNYPSDVIGAYLRMNETSANEQTRRVLSWLHESELNRGSFARAWPDSYTVEEEQKYYVRDKHGVYLLAKNQQADGRVETVAEIVEFYGVEEVELDYELTEQEIKSYDPRYWVFRKPVEELEE